MALDPSISLNVRPAQIESPLEQYGKVLSLRNAITQGQLQQQQLQMAPLQQEAARQENQQRQLQLDQTNALNEAYRGALTIGPDGTADIDTGKLGQALSQAGHGSAIPGVLKGVQEFKTGAANLAKINSEVGEKQANLGGSLGATVAAANNDPNLFVSLATHAIQAKSVDPQLAGGYVQHVQQLLAQDPTGETARQAVGQITSHLIAGSPEQQKLINEKATADARAKQAQTGADKFAMETPGIRAEGQIKQGEANAINMPPEIAQRQVGAVIDPAKYPDEYKQTLAAYQQALTLKDKNEVLNKALEGMRVTQRETNPAVIQARVNQAVQTETATSPLKVNQAVQTELAKARLAPGAVSAITDPVLQHKAIADYTKANDEYQAKAGDAQRLQSFVEAARSGNQAAAAMIPIAEVREIVSRVNRQELQAASGGVSAARNVENWLSGKVTGKPTDATLKDIEQLGKAMLDSSRRTYAGKVNVLNVLGGKFSTEPLEPPVQKSSAPTGGISVTAPDGSVHPFATQAQADAFRKLAGIK